MSAVTTGDVQGLVEVLDPEVVLIADGGGLAAAARKPIAELRGWWPSSPGRRRSRTSRLARHG